ncbi:MAG: plastocyanin/azurin family copper-binding protein [Pseudomonadota bacterium]
MSASQNSPSRRNVLRATVAVLCCPALAARATPSQVDQITDLSATAATGMFRFEPDFIRLDVGSEIAFLNSRGDHTVHTIPELWPDGEPRVAIAHKKEAVVHFPQAGLYGFRCRRHGQYGMVMLAAVGDLQDTAAARSAIEKMRAKGRERKALAALLDRVDNRG